jgi:hypothetical protein
MPTKPQRSVRLSIELWAQVDDIINYFGDSHSEVIAFILRDWFKANQPQIRETKGRIDQLIPPDTRETATSDATDS